MVMILLGLLGLFAIGILSGEVRRDNSATLIKGFEYYEQVAE
jgi:hypothetical protein